MWLTRALQILKVFAHNLRRTTRDRAITFDDFLILNCKFSRSSVPTAVGRRPPQPLHFQFYSASWRQSCSGSGVSVSGIAVRRSLETVRPLENVFVCVIICIEFFPFFWLSLVRMTASAFEYKSPDLSQKPRHQASGFPSVWSKETRHFTDTITKIYYVFFVDVCS